MGLFDFVTDLVGDVVEGATELVGDVVGGVVEGASGLVGDVVETGASVATGAIVGFVGGVKRGMDRGGEKTTKRFAKDELGFENYEEWEEVESDSEYCDAEEAALSRGAQVSADVIRSGANAVIGSNGMHPDSAITVKPVKIKTSPANELLMSLKKLREAEDRKIDKIKKSGDNLMANVAESLFSSPKRSKFLNIAKSISGKTNEEKLNELRDDYDEKRAKYIDRVIVPIDTFEMWEMYEAAIRLVKQPGLGIKEKTACRNLLERVIEECEMRFSGNEEKFAMVRNSKQKYLLGDMG